MAVSVLYVDEMHQLITPTQQLALLMTYTWPTGNKVTIAARVPDGPTDGWVVVVERCQRLVRKIKARGRILNRTHRRIEREQTDSSVVN